MNSVPTPTPVYSEHLRSKLRKANIAPHDPAHQLFLRAASQANTYISLVNARLQLEQHEGHRDLAGLLHTLDRVEHMK
jgi:hypothetical protein